MKGGSFAVVVDEEGVVVVGLVVARYDLVPVRIGAVLESRWINLILKLGPVISTIQVELVRCCFWTMFY